MQNDAKLRPWWATDREQTLQNRIDKINKLNDPTTSADEILKWGKLFLYLLLGYSALLGYFCYYKNFSKSFPIEVAIVLSVILPLSIEFGKNYCATWAIRQPFFHGFPAIFASKAKTFVFVGLALIGVATFVMSIRNSTIGSQQLSLMFSHERNASTFTSDTRAIDAQISDLEKSMAANRSIQWKGTVTYQAQKAIQREAGAKERLQQQRAETIRQQREDWEKDQQYKTDQGNGVASLVLASGGWVELLQFLFLFLRVACEKLLDNRMQRPANFVAFPNNNPTRNATPYPTIENRGFVYFNRTSPTGDVHATQPENTVSQSHITVTQPNEAATPHTVDAVLKLAKKELQGFAANFGRKYGKDSTVSDNINRILDETLEKLYLYRSLNYYPTRDQAITFYTYITGELFKNLNERGWPYEKDVEFAQMMFEMIPKKHPAT